MLVDMPQLAVKMRQMVRLAWHRRRQPRWVDGCCIVIYSVHWFIVPGTMVLGPFVFLAVYEVFPVIKFHVRVVVHEAPEYLPLFRGFPIIITWLPNEG